MSARAERKGRLSNDTMARDLEASKDVVRAVVVGYGPVGQTVTRILTGFGIRPVIVDLNVDTITRLREEGVAAVYGDASKADILRAAGIERARYLVLTLPDLAGRIPVILSARGLNAELRILARARYLAERPALEGFGVTAVCYEEAEAAVGLSELLLRAEGTDEEKIRAEGGRIRSEFALRPGTT